MALDNLISVNFTAEELSIIDKALADITSVLNGKAVNLTPKQRQQHGRLAYEMEVWVDKTYSYMQQDPQLVPLFIDMAEHTADLTAHRALSPRIDRLSGLLQSMKDTNLLLGSDIMLNSHAYYRSLREAAKANAIGASSKYADLKRQFPGPGKKSSSVEEAISDETTSEIQ
ncbi:MAG: hypothetical protein LBS80_04970 [Tannerella sp.]|jgi:hypothetical protein|nr:hypothetical protein [Tannerella sp.]